MMIVIQKKNTRYTFFESRCEDGTYVYSIYTREHLEGGDSLTSRYVTKEQFWAFYLKMMDRGFRRFRNINEVSWYATIKNNTPFEEEWEDDGDYLIPIKSRVLG